MNKQILFSLAFLATLFCIRPVTYVKFYYAGTDLQHALQGFYRPERKVINSAEEFLNVWDTIQLVFDEENVLLAAANGPGTNIVNSVFIGRMIFQKMPSSPP